MKYRCDTCGKEYAALPYAADCTVGGARIDIGTIVAGFGPQACLGKVYAIKDKE